MRFSRRLPAPDLENELSVELRRLRARGAEISDLTTSNPTTCGLFDSQATDAALAAALTAHGLATYAPDARGTRSAREAVAAALQQRWPADHLLLTASSSEAYGWLFKLLCEPGDRVLVPRPSYPLFEHLTALEGVVALPYDLSYAGGWQLDPAELDRAAAEGGDRVRALLVVNPNNPTGHGLHPAELSRLATTCAEHGWALIGDEVFFEYPFADAPALASVATVDRCLCFGLGGLSKLAALPQLKLGWIGVSGPAPLVKEAWPRLELIADTYLSVSTPIMQGAEALLALGAERRTLLRRRLAQNRQAIAELLAATHPEVTLLAADGGWTAVLRVPELRPEEELVLEILREEQVLVHPGYFFDFTVGAHLVVSLLPPTALLCDGLKRALRHL